MALPPWTIELLRRGIADAAKKARDPEALQKIKAQATEIIQEIPDTAARGIDAVRRGAEAGKKTVERWSRKQTPLAVPMLNASGVLLTDRGSGTPVAEVIGEVGREFMAGGVTMGKRVDQQLARRLGRLLLSGDDAIAITSNFPAALTAFSLLVQKTPLVIHRNHCVRLPSGKPLPEAFGMFESVIQEVGAVGSVSPADFDGLEKFCAILADGGQSPVELLQLGRRDFLQAVVLPVGTLSASGHESIPSAEAMLSQGADYVILPGDGVEGGPPCGIVVGRREGIEMIQASTAWPALAASDAVRAMMTLALELAAEQRDELPIGRLLSTSVENLRGRAERMATRLTGCDCIASCQVTAEDARLTECGRWKFPSRQLRLRHAKRSAGDWAASLQDQTPAVLAAPDGSDLIIDLRWISAASDNQLAEALGGESESPAAEGPQTGSADSPQTASADSPETGSAANPEASSPGEA
jgi:L-seryl-tRNA(Ser) seleniumtransferase